MSKPTYAREMAEKAALSIVDIKHTRPQVIEETIREVIERCAVEADCEHAGRCNGTCDRARSAARIRALAGATP